MFSSPRWRYRLRAIAAGVVYVVLILVTNPILHNMDSSDPWRYLIAVLPLLPMIFVLLSFMQFMREMDEMQRRIHFEAFGFSLACTTILTFTLGFLERAGFPRISMVWVAAMIIIFWAIGRVMATRRYR